MANIFEKYAIGLNVKVTGYRQKIGSKKDFGAKVIGPSGEYMQGTWTTMAIVKFADCSKCELIMDGFYMIPKVQSDEKA